MRDLMSDKEIPGQSLATVFGDAVIEAKNASFPNEFEKQDKGQADHPEASPLCDDEEVDIVIPFAVAKGCSP